LKDFFKDFTFNTPAEIISLLSKKIDIIGEVEYIKEVAFESDFRSFIHFIKSETKSHFIISNKVIKSITNNEVFETWTCLIVDNNDVFNQSKRLCFYTSPDRKNTLRSLALNNLLINPHFFYKLKSF